VLWQGAEAIVGLNYTPILSSERAKIWLWVLRDLHLRVIALAMPRSNCSIKLQTHPLVREGENLVVISAGLGPESRCSGKALKQL
jgi:hypothetical protein